MKITIDLLGYFLKYIFTPRNVMSSTGDGGRQTSKMMYDFRNLASVSNWVESSDTVREPGMSKGAFVLQVSLILNPICSDSLKF